jgi:predicted amidohydrolase
MTPKTHKLHRKKPIIALAQIRYSGISRENIDIIKRYIRLAKSRGADIVCFPEGCLSLRCRKNPFGLNHCFIKEIKEECRRNKIWCIINDDFVVRGETYSLALLINRNGRGVGKYRKINLSGDNELVVAGNHIKVFKTDFGKISIVICWDLILPELFKRIKKAGAEIVFCPAQWHHEEESYKKKYKIRDLKLLRSLVTTRAYENLYFVALCNPLTKRKDLVSYSAICSPHKMLREIVNKEGLITAQIDLEQIDKLHKLYKIEKK